MDRLIHFGCSNCKYKLANGCPKYCPACGYYRPHWDVFCDDEEEFV